MQVKHNGVTPLYIAAQNGHIDVVKLLLDNKTDVNASNHYGVTPLYCAAQNGHTKVVKLFLGNKANANASIHTACVTPVYVASEKEQRVKPPFAKKDKMNARGADMDTSTHTASATPVYSAGKKEQRVKPPLAKKTKINARGAVGDKPIDAARRNGHLKIVKLLQ